MLIGSIALPTGAFSDDGAPEEAWSSFDCQFLNAKIYDITGKYICTKEGFFTDQEGVTRSTYQKKGDIWTFEQHCSLVRVTVEEKDGKMYHLVGSAVGEQVILVFNGFDEWMGKNFTTQKIYDGFIPVRLLDSDQMKIMDDGAIVFSALGNGYDKDNRIDFSLVETGVLVRISD